MSETSGLEHRNPSPSPPSIGLRLHLLGPIRLFVDGESLKPPKRSQTTRLLAYLMLRPGEKLSRSAVAEELWPEEESSRARFNLRHGLHAINKLLPQPRDGQPWMVADRNSVEWSAEGGVWVDVAALATARAAAEAPESSDDLLERLSTADALYAGPLLPGMDDEWIARARDGAAEDYAIVLERLMSMHLERGEIDVAVATGHRLLLHDPTRESVHRQLMRAQAVRGDRAAALRQYEQAQEMLREQLGVQPEPETQELVEHIRSGAEISLGGQGRGHAVEVPTSWAPLPEEPWPFVDDLGRLAEVLERLERQQLLTVTGAAGIGKSRLAAEVARIWAAQGDRRVAWCALSGATVESWPLSLGAALGLPAGALGSSPVTMGDTIAAAFDSALGLLVLDDADDLLDPLVPLIEYLCVVKPELKILVTSREALRMSGEEPWPVPRLVQPGVVGRSSPVRGPSESEQLLLDAVRHATGGRAVPPAELSFAQRICHHLDGLPLAIVRIAPMIFEEGIAAVADAVDARAQAALTPALEAGWRRLSAAERCLLRRIAVFSDAASMAEVEAVCADANVGDVLPIPRSARSDADSEHVPPADVLDLVARLSARSWLAVEPGRPFRYALLPITRSWLLTRLEESGEMERIRAALETLDTAGPA